MRAVNYTTQTPQDVRSLIRGIATITGSEVEFGYFGKGEKYSIILYKEDLKSNEYIRVKLFNQEENQPKLTYSNWLGDYIITSQHTESELIRHTETMLINKFPYTFDRRYEAVENLDLFASKQNILNPKVYPFANELKYTFGLEFETSMGIIPEKTCFTDGLIPLRDGSISGLEYSTVVLQGNNGLNLLSQQLQTLREYTIFNKECSLHMHLGGYPVNEKALFILYWVMYYIQSDLLKYIPKYTFSSERYKKSGKNYCKALSFTPSTFKDLYRYYVGADYNNSLTAPHPADTGRTQKWHINGRYYMCNFINMFCYSSPKTIEFRFLRPTYNHRKIMAWLFAFNAILRYAESITDSVSKYSTYAKLASVLNEKAIANEFTLVNVLEKVYPKELAEKLKIDFTAIEVLTRMQLQNEDFWGYDVALESKIIHDDE